MTSGSRSGTIYLLCYSDPDSYHHSPKIVEGVHEYWSEAFDAILLRFPRAKESPGYYAGYSIEEWDLHGTHKRLRWWDCRQPEIAHEEK